MRQKVSPFYFLVGSGLYSFSEALSNEMFLHYYPVGWTLLKYLKSDSLLFYIIGMQVS